MKHIYVRLKYLNFYCVNSRELLKNLSKTGNPKNPNKEMVLFNKNNFIEYLLYATVSSTTKASGPPAFYALVG